MAYRSVDGTVADRSAKSDWVEAAAAPPLAPDIPGGRSHRKPAPSLPRCPELDCVRHLLPPGLIAYAEMRAAEIGVSGDRVLMGMSRSMLK